MTPWLVTFVVVLLAIGGFTIFGRESRITPLFLGALYVVVLVGGASALGLPKPYWLGLPSTQDVEVIAATWDEGHAIWVWVREPGSSGPRAFALPWNEKQASKLNEDLEKKKEDGVEVRIKMPIGWSPEVPFMSYPAPQQPLPPKDGAQ